LLTEHIGTQPSGLLISHRECSEFYRGCLSVVGRFSISKPAMILRISGASFTEGKSRRCAKGAQCNSLATAQVNGIEDNKR
jgi:hypothetical protein